MANNKVIYNGNILIDLTGDSVAQDKLLQGYTAHDKSGAIITGNYTPPVPVTQQKVVTPQATGFDVTPSSGYDYLTKVTVGAIPYETESNSAGGTTVKIATEPQEN